MPGFSVSIIMPALNEERALASSVAAVKAGLDALCEYEIIICDDGSTDRTGQKADALAAHDGRIRVHHHAVNQGVGACYRRGVELARHEYVLMVPADDETPADTIRMIVVHAGEADIVATYTLNGHIRPLHRRILSRAFTMIMNALFGLRLRYYNGNCLIRTSILRAVPIDTSGFSYMAAILVRLLRRGHDCLEIGILLQPRGGKSKALRPKSFVNVCKSVLALVWEVRIRRGAPSSPSVLGG